MNTKPLSPVRSASALASAQPAALRYVDDEVSGFFFAEWLQRHQAPRSPDEYFFPFFGCHDPRFVEPEVS